MVCLISVVFPEGGLSSGWSFMRVVSHQGGLSLGWSLIRVVFHQGGLSSGWCFIWVVSCQRGLSSGWSLSREIFHQEFCGSVFIFVQLCRVIFVGSRLCVITPPDSSLTGPNFAVNFVISGQMLLEEL